MASFIKPNQLLSQDKVIPPDVLRNAKGLVVMTVLKGGFLFSGRAGSGVIVARLPDGGWSAPSAVVTAGAGVGGQIGAELTDFVFVLNSRAAVESFSKAGSITLGGNVSLAAGPLGRNAEAAGSATVGAVAAIFAYSKTKGLFAGVSLEGSVLIERREANRKFYGENCTAKSILSGRVEPPPEVDPLFRVLESRAFSGEHMDYYDDEFYDDIPDEFSSVDSRRGSSVRVGGGGGGRSGAGRRRYDDYDDYYDDDYEEDRRTPASSRGGRSNTWQDDVYDAPTYSSRSRRDRDRDPVDDMSSRLARSRLSDRDARDTYSSRDRYGDRDRDRYGDRYGDRDRDRPRYSDRDDDHYGSSKRLDDPLPPSPAKRSTPTANGAVRAVAKFKFEGEESGDLSFKKGDIITIVKKTDTTNDWWTGSIDGREGIFPANYVELV